MEKPCLNVKEEYPDDKVLSRYLGKVKNTWDSFMDFIEENYPSFSGEWRYYKDGKSWLYKLTKKKKTICWISVYDNQLINGKRYGKIRGITVTIKKPVDLNSTKKLIAIKEQIK